MWKSENLWDACNKPLSQISSESPVRQPANWPLLACETIWFKREDPTRPNFFALTFGTTRMQKGSPALRIARSFAWVMTSALAAATCWIEVILSLSTWFSCRFSQIPISWFSTPRPSNIRLPCASSKTPTSTRFSLRSLLAIMAPAESPSCTCSFCTQVPWLVLTPLAIFFWVSAWEIILTVVVFPNEPVTIIFGILLTELAFCSFVIIHVAIWLVLSRLR